SGSHTDDVRSGCMPRAPCSTSNSAALRCPTRDSRARTRGSSSASAAPNSARTPTAVPTYSCRAAASASTARCMGSASTRPIGAGPWVASSWLIWFVLRSSRRSERDVAVLLRRKRRSLRAQGAQGAHDLHPGLGRADHRVDVPALGGVPRVHDRVLVL